MNWTVFVPIGISLLLAGFNAAIFIVIKFNDLAHLSKGFEDLKSSIKDIDNKLDLVVERVAKIEGRLK